MKLILIKIGKALKVLRQDGIFGGSKRIVNYLAALLKTIFSKKEGDILIITGGLGDSALYRSKHYCEELHNKGFKCSLTVIEDPFLLRYAENFKIFIFHRTFFIPKIEKLIKKIEGLDKEIIFDTDDLVFDSKYLEKMNYRKEMNTLEKKQYIKGVGEEILKDPYIKTCTTTTTFLAEKLREYSKQVFIIPNKLSEKDLEIVKEIENKKSQISNLKSQISLGYFSGTISHNKDFAVITDVLMQIMEKHSNVKLFLVGPLNIENRLNKFKDRIKQLPYVPRKKHFENIAQVDINLAPLEIGNPFCESKSELKFFEAGILEIPTVASATQTFREAVNNGIDGFVASTTEEWIEKLDKLITDEKLRISMGKKAKEKVLEKYTTKNSENSEYYNYLKSKLLKFNY